MLFSRGPNDRWVASGDSVAIQRSLPLFSILRDGGKGPIDLTVDREAGILPLYGKCTVNVYSMRGSSSLGNEYPGSFPHLRPI